MQELIKKIEQWAIDREVNKKGTVERQSIKTAEKMAELIKGISKDNVDSIKGSIGEVFVSLIIGNILDTNINMEECYTEAKTDFKMYSIEDKKCAINYSAHVITDIIQRGYYEYTLFFGLVDLMAIADIYNLNFENCVENSYAALEDIKMDRDIKFRAWYKKIKKMCEVVQIDFYNEKVGYLFADTTIQGETVGYLKFSDIELMQFTGFKDDNGVEIYEGDIVESYMDNGYQYGILSGVVEFVDGCYFVNNTLLTDLSDVVQVIGNKYEY